MYKFGGYMLSQKECVFATIEEFFTNNGLTLPNKVSLSLSDKKLIVEALTDKAMLGCMSLEPESKAKYHSRDLMLGYCTKLLNNWLRKDIRLNGGVKFFIKNPGSKAGTSDPQIKQLKEIKSKIIDATYTKAIDEQINIRLSKLNNNKKFKSINKDLLPEEIQSLIKDLV